MPAAIYAKNVLLKKSMKLLKKSWSNPPRSSRKH